VNWLNFFETKTELKHKFGRGINANLHEDEEDLFNKSYEAFERKDILDAYEYFFKSLQNYSNDISNNNIILNRENDKLNFEIYQGSSRINGYVTKEHLYADSILTKKTSKNIALKRYLLERNYQLTYAVYFSDDKYIRLKIFHDNITMSPQKIFFPLREIALNADYDKEYTKNEFNVTIEDIGHLKPLNENELEIKFNYLHKWIDIAMDKISTFPSNDNAGMQSFTLLYLFYKIDYLIVPKYKIYQKTSKKVQKYFNDDTLPIEAKNEELKNYLHILREMPLDEFRENFYDAKYTFNPSEKTSHEEMSLFISESLTKIRWYKNNRYNQVIPIIYKYIGLHLLYNYGLNPVIKQLLHTLIEIQNPDFFAALEYEPLYDEDNDSFSNRAIITKIEEIISPYKSQFKSLEPFGDKLNFNSLNEFSNSFYLQLNDLNFEEI
jgi:hypothetical protein